MLEKRIKFKHGSLDLFFRISYSQLFFFFFKEAHEKSFENSKSSHHRASQKFGLCHFFY